MPGAARERVVTPRAGTALVPLSKYPRERSLRERDGDDVIDTVTDVNSLSQIKGQASSGPSAGQSGEPFDTETMPRISLTLDPGYFNPVKHQRVTRARDWPYSSFHAYVERGLLPADWAGDAEEPMMAFGKPSG